MWPRPEQRGTFLLLGAQGRSSFLLSFSLSFQRYDDVKAFDLAQSGLSCYYVQHGNSRALTPEFLRKDALTPEFLRKDALTPEFLRKDALTPEFLWFSRYF